MNKINKWNVEHSLAGTFKGKHRRPQLGDDFYEAQSLSPRHINGRKPSTSHRSNANHVMPHISPVRMS